MPMINPGKWYRFKPALCQVRRSIRSSCGFTLVEVAISILIIMVLATGAMGYQYHSTRDVKLSEVQATASRLSMLLLEGWKGTEGASDFDPVSVFGSEITITTSSIGPDVAQNKWGWDFDLLDQYVVEMDEVVYYVTLSWNDASFFEPKVLNCVVTWRNDYTQGQLEGHEPFIQYSAYFVNY